MKRIYDGDPTQNQALSSYRSLAEKATEALRREEGSWLPFDESQLPSRSDTEGEVFNHLLGEALKKPLEKLPLRWRYALVHNAVDGETLEDIGARLGVTKSRAGEIIEQARHAMLDDPDVRLLYRFLKK